MVLLIDRRENEILKHKLLAKMGDFDTDPKGTAQVLHLTSGDYILGEWGVEAKEINDLYRSILGIGRNRTIVAQLHDLCETFDKPFLVVYNTELKPYFHGRRPTARQIQEEKAKMRAVIKSFKMTMHQRFPKLHFLQLNTMDDFVEWLYTNYRQNLISKVKIPKKHEADSPVRHYDNRIKTLMNCGIGDIQAEKLLAHYGNLTVILRKGTKQKEMMEVAGITRKQAKAILSLREDFNKS
jgi:ERCC4-type nuclease